MALITSDCAPFRWVLDAAETLVYRKEHRYKTKSDMEAEQV